MDDHPVETDHVDPNSEQGLEILKHAFSGGKKVLEFHRKEDGEMTVADITDHHNELQDAYNDGQQTSRPSGE